MNSFESKMHRDGRLYGWTMLLAICAFPLFASIKYNIWPDFGVIWPGVLTMWILMASYVLSEMIAFPPILGPGSLYLTYITGNLQNQKIPCALSAMSIAGIEGRNRKGKCRIGNCCSCFQYNDNGDYCTGYFTDDPSDSCIKFTGSGTCIQ